MVVAEGNSSQQPNKLDKEENSITANKQDNGSESNKKRTEENDNEKVEVDEFGRMLRRDSRRDDDYDHSDHSDYDRYKSESRRYSSSSSIRSSRQRSSEDYYDSRPSHYHPRNDHGRQLHYDRYVPSRSSYHRHSDSDREDRYDDDRFRDRKRARTWSRRSSDSEEEHERRRSSSSRRHRSLDRNNEPEGRRWSNNNYEDQYQVASKYIDTEFYTKKIYVGELKDVTERALHMAFERFGDIENIDMVSEKGIAFIDFDTEENAAEARRKMNGTLLGSGHIQVNRAKRPERNLNGFGNVPWSDADGATAKQNDIKQITYGIQYSFQSAPYVNGPPQYITTINGTGYLVIQLYLIFRKRSYKRLTILLLVPAPSSQPPLDPRAQGHKRKIIAYDDL